MVFILVVCEKHKDQGFFSNLHCSRCSENLKSKCDINDNSLMIWSLKLLPIANLVATHSLTKLRTISIWRFVAKKNLFNQILKTKLIGPNLLFKMIDKFGHFKIRVFKTFDKVVNNFFENLDFTIIILIMDEMVKVLLYGKTLINMN